MPPREIKFKVPRVPGGLLSNLVGLAGLIAITAAIGGLTGSWWWSAVVGGVFAVALSWMASTDEEEVAAVAAPAGMSGGTVHQLDAARAI